MGLESFPAVLRFTVDTIDMSPCSDSDGYEE